MNCRKCGVQLSGDSDLCENCIQLEEKRKRKLTGRKTCDLVSDRYSSGHAEYNTPFRLQFSKQSH